MTRDESLNRAIHEWMGRGEWVLQEVEYCEKCGVEGITEIGSPDYTKDRDAVREFLTSITEENDLVDLGITLKRYGSEASLGHMRNGNSWLTMTPEIALVHISPRQLAEAGAKAVGIWEEENDEVQ